MPHNQYTLLAGDNFPQGLSLYSGLYPGIFLYLLALSSVISNILRRFHYRLVTAPAQGKINGIAGKFIILRITQSVQSDPDADSHCHFVSDIDGFDLLQKIEFAGSECLRRFPAKDNHILVLLYLLTDTVLSRNIFIHLSVDQCNQQGTPYLLHTLKGFIIIIQVNQSHCQALIFDFLKGNPKGRLVKQIKSDQIPFIIFRVDNITAAQHFPQGNLAHLCRIKVIFKDKILFRQFNFPRQLLPCN